MGGTRPSRNRFASRRKMAGFATSSSRCDGRYVDGNFPRDKPRAPSRRDQRVRLGGSLYSSGYKALAVCRRSLPPLRRASVSSSYGGAILPDFRQFLAHRHPLGDPGRRNSGKVLPRPLRLPVRPRGGTPERWLVAGLVWSRWAGFARVPPRLRRIWESARGALRIRSSRTGDGL